MDFLLTAYFKERSQFSTTIPGVHIFLVSNRLNNETVSPYVKANIPARAVFYVTSGFESNFTGVKGAEKPVSG
jgi:hypothetical protein